MTIRPRQAALFEAALACGGYLEGCLAAGEPGSGGELAEGEARDAHIFVKARIAEASVFRIIEGTAGVLLEEHDLTISGPGVHVALDAVLGEEHKRVYRIAGVFAPPRYE